MKTKASSFKLGAGYSLSEVIIAVGVVAISVPLVLALVVAGGESSQLAERETRSVFTARTIFEEVALAEKDNSELIEREDLPWSFPEEGDESGLPTGKSGNSEWLMLELDNQGAVIAANSGLNYEEAWSGTNPEVRGLAALRGYQVEIEESVAQDGEPLEVFQLELRIEYPARAEAADREGSVFVKVNSSR